MSGGVCAGCGASGEVRGEDVSTRRGPLPAVQRGPGLRHARVADVSEGFWDGRLIPIERPEKRTALQERLEGRQIARLVYFLSPHEEWGCGLELTSGARMAFWSTQDRGASRYRWRIMIRYLPPQRIWTKSMVAHFTNERKYALKGEEAADALQERVEGGWIEGARPTPEPSPAGGEVIVLELRGGEKLKIEALPPKNVRGRPFIRADMNVELIEAPSKTISMPGLILP